MQLPESFIDPQMVKFFNSRLDQAAADKFINELIPPTEEPEPGGEQICQTLTALILRLAYDDDGRRREDNARVLIQTIFRRSAAYDLQRMVFMDAAIQSALPALASPFPALAAA